ncbi:MAG: hypothetical protein IPN53_19885 [Comamonadaceae bacterium]|nr:hypothetical protein [Comamonadaceae bacterium]
MKCKLNTLCVAVTLAVMGSVALAKLPAPSDEAKAKAAEAAAKTAWAGKVDNYKLCLSQDKVVAHVKKVPVKVATAPAKGASAPAAGACADPGPFVYAPTVPIGAAAPVTASSGAPVAVAPPKKP